MSRTVPVRLPRSVARRIAGGALALALAASCAAGLSACQPEPLADGQHGAGSGSVQDEHGAWEEIPVESRGAPVDFSGPSTEGGELASAELRGAPAAVNFWYAACPPCRAEAPDLVAAAAEYAPKGVRFVGVNIYDAAPTVESFDASYGVPYPSILDVDSSSVRLAFAGAIPLQAVPSTAVLDRQGRIAAVIRGPVDPRILGPMLDRVLAEAA